VPITYVVHPQDHVVVVTLSGELCVADYASTLQEALGDPRYEPGSAILLDARRIDPLPSVDDLRGLVGLAKELSVRDVKPFAIVVANELQYLVGRLFATLASATIHLETRVFRTTDVALAWLRSVLASRSEPSVDALGAGPTPLSS
jgi:stage II sporulation SpoAA-like protein